MGPTDFGKMMDIEDLVAVHLTKYFPQNGMIKTLNSMYPEVVLRNTVHFTVNHPVEDVGFYGSWTGTTYAILTPLDKLCHEQQNDIWNFNVVDTYFIGDVTLPQGSTVIVSAQCYNDLIKERIVDKELLMSTFFDERRSPTSDDQLVIEKEGIRYIILSWNSDTLRKETYKEICKQGYKCMPSGQWNWGNRGADKKDQERIAEKIGAKRCGTHCDDELYLFEELSLDLSGMVSDKKKISILYYCSLPTDKRVIPLYSSAEEQGLESDKYHLGKQILESLPGLIKWFETNAKKGKSLDFQQRIDYFVNSNKDRLREFIPQEAIDFHQLPL